MSRSIPPHRPIVVPGVHGYASAKTVHAGQRIDFHLSSDRPYHLSVCRLGPDADSRSSDIVIADLGTKVAQVQPIHPGSYVHVERGLPAALPLAGLTLECWVMPWRCTGARQALISQYSAPDHCGFGLFVEADGALALYLGDGGTQFAQAWRAGGSLVARRWQHVAATWDGEWAALWIDGVCAGRWPFTGPVRPGPAPLRLGAAGEQQMADALADADLAQPVIYERGLSAEEIRTRVAVRTLRLPTDAAVRACWPLREGRGDRVADTSGHQRDGRIVNHGTWLIRGPAFDEVDVGVQDPFAAPASRHGLRLASDDLYDCRWTATHSLTLPHDARPGLHVARLRFDWDGREAVYDITFLVKRRADASPAPLLVLCAMSSWLAYAATPFARNQVEDPVWPRRSTGLPNSHPQAPAFCSYTRHHAGQPSYFTGLRMPWPNASPAALYDPADAGFSQWTRLERRLHAWLEREGYDFDLLADLDVHQNPNLLERRRTVIVNGHSEYWSTPVVDAFDAFLRHGGQAVVLSGNTMYLRVSFDEDMGVMEQRKNNERGVAPADAETRPPAGPFGEEFHSQDWARGGQLRAVGRSAASIIGLESAGWAFANAEDFGVYHVTTPAHALFNHPYRLGLERGQTFGHAPGGGLPRAIGHEWDLSTATLLRMTHRHTPGAELPEPPPGLTVIAQGIRRVPGPLDAYLDWFSRVTDSLDGLSAEMIYWERPQGGRVFHAGAVGAAWVIGRDPMFDGLLHNVLHHFGCDPR